MNRHRFSVLVVATCVCCQVQAQSYPHADVPAGTMVAFTRGHDASADTTFDTPSELATTDVYLKRRGRPARLISSAGNGTADFTPSISPDGTKVAWATYHAECGTLDIIVKDLTTDAPAEYLTHTFADGRKSNERWPNWSADGSKIIFLRAMSVPKKPLDVWQMNSDGSGHAAITEANSDVEDCCADYLPNTDAVIYASKQRSPARDMDIYFYDLSTGVKRALTTASGYQGTPSPEHDGSVLYRDGKTGKINRINPSVVDSGVELAGMPAALYARRPAGSPPSLPGSKKIIFSGYTTLGSGRNSTTKLFIARGDGSAPTRIKGTSSGNPDLSETDASWGIDGLDR